jgi:hypothetical protein
MIPVIVAFWIFRGLLGPGREFSTGVRGLVNYLRTNQGGNEFKASVEELVEKHHVNN